VEKKYVDVNVFIYWLSGSGELMNRAKNWITKVEKGERGEYLTSVLTVYEALVIISGLTGHTLKDRGFVEEIINAFFELERLVFVPLTRDIVKDSLFFMKRFNLDFEDAIHYATARKHRAKKIITNDKDYLRTDIKPIF